MARGTRSHVAGRLGRAPRSAEAIESVLGIDLGVPVEVVPFVPRWLTVPDHERMRLGRQGCRLGRDAVVGGRVWDAQHGVELRIGPLDRPTYDALQPGGARASRLCDWVRTLLGDAVHVRLRLILDVHAVPEPVLGRVRLGRSAWIGRRPACDATDFAISCDRLPRGA